MPTMPTTVPITPLLILTAYRPFQGRKVNGSETLLRWVRKHKFRWPQWEIATRSLPVTWSEAPKIFKKHLAKVPLHRPVVVLSMGEGKAGRIAWEQRAVNAASGADEAGGTVPECIQPGGSAFLDGRWKLDFPSELSPHPIVQSLDAGKFLCNRLLWEILTQECERRLQGGEMTSAFLHLPPQGEESGRKYLRHLTPLLDYVLKSESTQASLRKC